MNNTTIDPTSQDVLNVALNVLDIEIAGLLKLKTQLDKNFLWAVDSILSCKGKIVLSGIGKSGHIARKISSTFSSTGTSSFYLHPAEGAHGDFGMINSDDLPILISYGGESSELTLLIKYLKRRDIPFIAITGKTDSTLGREAKITLCASVDKEGCPLGLAPTASTTVCLALGDALAMALLHKRGFQAEDFAVFHPGGSLGFKLLTRAKDLMHSGQSLPLVPLNMPMIDVIKVMTGSDVRGTAGVVDGNRLIGVVTDGDLRRCIDQKLDFYTLKASDIMNKSPKVIGENELAEVVLKTMETHQIQSLFVTKDQTENEIVGIIHIQDMLKAKIK